MLFRRIYQFLIVYMIGLALLMGIKYCVGLSDYVIPGLALVIDTTKRVSSGYFVDAMSTLSCL